MIASEWSCYPIEAERFSAKPRQISQLRARRSARLGPAPRGTPGGRSPATPGTPPKRARLVSSGVALGTRKVFSNPARPRRDLIAFKGAGVWIWGQAAKPRSPKHGWGL